MRALSLVLALAAGVSILSPARAGFAPVEVAPIAFQQASLTVEGPAGAKVYTPAQIEALGTVSLTTITPWRTEPATFVGVLLADILADAGLADAQAIEVTAENGYAVVIPRSAWTEHPCLVATRVNGKAHTRRERGPLQFVYDMSGNAELGNPIFEANWVWMAARIRRAD